MAFFWISVTKNSKHLVSQIQLGSIKSKSVYVAYYEYLMFSVWFSAHTRLPKDHDTWNTLVFLSLSIRWECGNRWSSLETKLPMGELILIFFIFIFCLLHTLTKHSVKVEMQIIIFVGSRLLPWNF